MEQRKSIKLTADVVVVGTGFAGLSAALEARHHGAEVILLGRKGLLASNSAMSGSQVALVGTPLQKRMGIQDSNELLLQDLMKANKHSVDLELMRPVANAAGELYDWLTGFGADFHRLMPWPSHSVLRVHEEVGERDNTLGRGGRLIKLMHRAAQEKGVDVHMGMPATGLLTDKRGRVVGVRARDEEGRETEVDVRRGVVLAAGGFARDNGLIQRYAPKLVGMSTISAAGCTGDGIRMGMEVGAAGMNLDSMVLSLSVCTPDGGRPACNVQEAFVAVILGLAEGIAINKEGRRFMDESFGYARASSRVMLQTDWMAFAIFDEETRNKVSGTIDLFTGTPAELAAKINVDGSALAETIASYNASLPRVDVDGRPIQKRPLNAPLFAVPFTCSIVMTHGGLKINPQAQVIHREGHVIPGLYAAGDNTPGMGGPADGVSNACPGYISGTGNLTALAYGRIAGRNAATTY